MSLTQFLVGERYFKDGFYGGYVKVTRQEGQIIWGRYFLGNQMIDQDDKFWYIQKHVFEDYEDRKFFERRDLRRVVNPADN